MLIIKTNDVQWAINDHDLFIGEVLDTEFIRPLNYSERIDDIVTDSLEEDLPYQDDYQFLNDNYDN